MIVNTAGLDLSDHKYCTHTINSNAYRYCDKNFEFEQFEHSNIWVRLCDSEQNFEQNFEQAWVI